MTEPNSPDLQFDDLLTVLDDNNVGGITPEDVRSIAALSRPSTASLGGTGVDSTEFGAKLSAGAKLNSNTDVTYLRLADFYSYASTNKHSNYYGKLALLDTGSGKVGIKYDAVAGSAQPRTFRYEWEVVLETTELVYWALTFYYLPSGSTWPTSPTSTAWDDLKIHHSRIFYDPYGRTVESGDLYQSRTSGTKSIILNPGDTLVPVVEYWGTGSSVAPATATASVNKWSFDVAATGLADTAWNADGKYFDVANNRSTVEFDLIDLSAAASGDDTVVRQPIYTYPAGVTKSDLPVDAEPGTTAYLREENCLYTFRGGASATVNDWLLVRDFDTAFDGARPVVADTTANLSANATAGDFSSGTLAYDTTTKDLKVYTGTAWRTFSTINSAGLYPQVVSAVTASLPAATAVAPGTVAYDETTGQLKVSDGAAFYFVRDLKKSTGNTANRPAAPFEGQQYYDTEVDGLLVYTTSTTGWRAPWNLPWGIVPAAAGGTGGYAHTSITAAQTGVTTTNTAVSNLYASWAAVKDRRYRTTVSGHVLSSTAGDAVRVMLFDGTNVSTATVVAQFDIVSPSASLATHFTISYSETAASTATLTRQVAIVRGGGSGTVQFYAESSSPNRRGYIQVEDIGPVAGPA